jgi:hypothetical protein
MPPEDSPSARIFSKTGTSKQAELMILLRNSVPPARPEACGAIPAALKRPSMRFEGFQAVAFCALAD